MNKAKQNFENEFCTQSTQIFIIGVCSEFNFYSCFICYIRYFYVYSLLVIKKNTAESFVNALIILQVVSFVVWIVVYESIMWNH